MTRAPLTIALFSVAAAAFGPRAWARLEIPQECLNPQATLIPTAVRTIRVPFSAVIAKDGSRALGSDLSEDESRVIDMRTGAARTVKWRDPPAMRQGTRDFPQDDGNTLVRIDPHGEVWLMNAGTRLSTRFGRIPKTLLEQLQGQGSSIHAIFLSPDKRQLVVGGDAGLYWIDSQSKHRKISAMDGSLVRTLEFAESGTIRFSSGEPDALRVDEWNSSSGTSTQRFDPSQVNWAALGVKPAAAGARNNEAEPKPAPAREPVARMTYHPASRQIVVHGSNGRKLVQSIDDTGRVRVEPALEILGADHAFSGSTPLQVDEDGRAQSYGAGERLIYQVEAVSCIDPLLKVAVTDNDRCRSGTGLGQEQSARIAREFLEKQLCGSAFDARAWDRATGAISLSSESRPIARERAELLWLRFQKPGGIDAAKHTPVLAALLRSEIARQDPGGTRAILQNLAKGSNALYREIIARIPALLKISQVDPTTHGRCQTAAERVGLMPVARTELESLLKPVRESPQQARFNTTFATWEALAPFSNLLATLPAAEKEEHLDLIGQSLADAAATSPEFADVFLSKLYKFGYRAAAPLFGETTAPVTDITYTRSGSELRPIILGTEPIEASGKRTDRNSYGFYAQELDPVEAPETTGAQVERTVKWKHGPKSYSATLAVRAEKMVPLVPEGRAPDYEALWKDDRLSGMVVIGSNLKGSSASLMQEYLAYYQAHGFKFDRRREEIADFAKHLEEQTASGELDYLIKEAHSDGDEKNLFRSDLKVKVLRGERVVPGTNRRERIELVYPASETGESRLISNQEFGQWIRRRENDGGGQLVYFNTSCWSHTKALHEIEAARSTRLLNIATQTGATTFVHESADNGLYQMLEGFRARETYDQMRARFGKIPRYVDGEGDVYLFPDDRRYRELITDKIVRPLDIRLEVRDEDGKPYSIDVQH